MSTLHVVVPFYNEPDTLEPCLRRVVGVHLPEPWTMRLTVVDDHSNPAARADAERVVQQLTGEGVPIRLLQHPVNRGKGAALRTGFDAILGDADDGDVVIVQDADLEYDPHDYPTLLQPISAGESAVVIGTRWGSHRDVASMKRRIHAWGNRMLSRLSNLMTSYDLHDMECCYKLFRIDVLRRLRPLLNEDRFGVEPQIIASLARLREPIVEVPIRYEPRGFSAGKKIGWRDGVRALYVIVRERMKAAPLPPAKPEGVVRAAEPAVRERSR